MVSADDSLSVSAYSGLLPEAVQGGSSAGVVTSFAQNGSTGFTLGYDVTAKDSYATGAIFFDVKGVAVPGSVVMGLRAAAGSTLRVEVEDASNGADKPGRKAIFEVVVADGDVHKYAFNLAGSVLPKDFDPSKIRSVTVAVSNASVGAAKVGELEVQTVGLRVIPVVSADDSLSVSAVIWISAKRKPDAMA